MAPAGTVLEIGSANGRDALFLEQQGRRVRRTDATRAFVEMLRAQGHEASVLNVLTDDLVDVADGPYAAVLADAVFLHFTPDQLRTALGRVAAALAAGGVLAFTVKQGTGSGWSEHKLGLPRYFHYWQPGPIRTLLEQEGWDVLQLELEAGSPWGWISVLARPAPGGGDAPPAGLGSDAWA